jgi:hypothetical protein
MQQCDFEYIPPRTVNLVEQRETELTGLNLK